MTNIEVNVTGQNACAKASGLLASGTVGLPVTFMFDGSWDGLTKTVVFRAGNVSRDVVDIGSDAVVPWEVMQKAGCTLQIGVYGVNEAGTLVMPTVWADAGIIAPGADPTGDPGTDPTPPVWQQTLLKATAAAQAAEQSARAAQQVEAAYKAGELEGKTPVKGVDYYTEADKTEMVNAVIAALPTYNGEVEAV